VVHVSIINTFKSIYCAFFHTLIKYDIILGVTLVAVGRFSVYKRKSSKLWMLYNPELHVVRLEILPVPCQYILSLINIIISNQENFQINIYTLLIYRINTIFQTKCQPLLFSKKYIQCWH